MKLNSALLWGVPFNTYKKINVDDKKPGNLSDGVLEYLKDYIEQFPNNKEKSLFIFERPQESKTSYFSAFETGVWVINQIIKKGKITKRVCIIQVPSFPFTLNNFSQNEELENLQWTSSLSDIVLFNDLGSLSLSPSQCRLIYSLLVQDRYNGQHLIITTDNNLREIEENVGTAIAKFISKMKKIEV